MIYLWRQKDTHTCKLYIHAHRNMKMNYSYTHEDTIYWYAEEETRVDDVLIHTGRYTCIWFIDQTGRYRHVDDTLINTERHTSRWFNDKRRETHVDDTHLYTLEDIYVDDILMHTTTCRWYIDTNRKSHTCKWYIDVHRKARICRWYIDAYNNM